MGCGSVTAIKRYTPGDRAVWDGFVQLARNGLFIFMRDYIEYHRDRFEEHSYIAYCGDRPIGLLPANRVGETLYSHQGLTWGGWIIHQSMGSAVMLQLLEFFTEIMRQERMRMLRYKSIPTIYSACPAQEDIYALHRQGAHKAICNVAAVIDYRFPLAASQRRERGKKKAQKHEITVKKTQDYQEFFAMLTTLLKEKYGVLPVHNCEEMERLARLFPENIHLYVAYKSDRMIAGVIIYEFTYVVRAQYIASNEEGRFSGALDILFSYLKELYRDKKRYFDLGTSNEDNGKVLNTSLAQFKEELGGRAITYDIYELQVPW